MIIEDSTLLAIDKNDVINGRLILPNGILHIPEDVGMGIGDIYELHLPDTIQTYNPTAFRFCKDIHTVRIPKKWARFCPVTMFLSIRPTTVIYGDRPFDIEYHANMSFYIERTRNIMGVEIKYARRTNFNETGVCGKQWFVLSARGFTIADENFAHAITGLHKNIELQKFKKILSQNTPNTGDSRDKPWALLSNAFGNTINCMTSFCPKMRNHLAQETKKIPDVIKRLKQHSYKHGLLSINHECIDVNWERLNQIIYPIGRAGQKSITKRIKHTPFTANQINRLLINEKTSWTPGCFPIEWFKNVNKTDISKTTKKLHKILKEFSVALYNIENAPDAQTQDKILELKEEIAVLLNTHTQITKLLSGNFSKAFKIVVNNKECCWKIYHSNRSTGYLEYNNQNSVEQDSFIVSGKKQYGKQRFNQIYTASISTRRAERYTICPFQSEPKADIETDPYGQFKRFNYGDAFRDGNFIGKTIVDIGCTNINREHFDYPYFTKVVNSILFQGWPALTFVLTKHSKSEIRKVLDFIEKKSYCCNSPREKTIHAKLEFLRNKTR